MLFNSFIFILAYLPIVFVIYHILARCFESPSVRLAFLALASLLFYGYWDMRFVPVLALSIGINYLFSVLLSIRENSAVSRKVTFSLAIIVNLGLLGFYKYTNFAIDIINLFTHEKIGFKSIDLPLGISFFTFTQIAYLADLYAGHPREKSIIKYILFVTYFPHLIAGPILHHGEMMPQFNKLIPKRAVLDQVVIGLTVFSLGLFKKVIIADGFSRIANPIFTAATHGRVEHFDALGGALAYALQIYFDFSGYSDMAIGLSLLFGITLPFNFNSPYKSRSIVEFWQRWHITLSRFLRDYLYIPIGGNRCGKVRRYLNLSITMLLGGLWHGAGWPFLIWGALHGSYLTVNHAWRSFLRRHPSLLKMSDHAIYNIWCLLLTQFFVVIAWIYFRADDLHSANVLSKSIFTFHHLKNYQPVMTPVNFVLITLAYLVCFVSPNLGDIFGKWEIGLKTYQMEIKRYAINLKWNMNVVWSLVTAIIFAISLFAILLVGDGTQFLYFQF